MPKVSIGMPVYNGEKIIRNALDSLLSQTFTNFELIISDNASTDSTSTICMEYAKKDERIQYIRQPKNIGGTLNFYFVLKNAKGEYFMWASADDIWEPSFIEKNIKILESDTQIVGSISIVDKFTSYPLKDSHDSSVTNFAKYSFVHPVSGSYEEKVAFCLKFRQGTMFYATYRTQELRQSIDFTHKQGDLEIILNVVKYGDIHVVDEILMHRFAGGTSTKSIIHTLRTQNHYSYSEILLLCLPLVKLCLRTLGLKFVLRNLRSILYLHYIVYGRITLDLLRWIRSKIKRVQ